jgi:hypothetical protein
LLETELFECEDEFLRVQDVEPERVYIRKRALTSLLLLHPLYFVFCCYPSCLWYVVASVVEAALM